MAAAIEPAPILLTVVSSISVSVRWSIHGSTMESSSVLCSNRAAILVVLCAFVCHAQMTHRDLCQAELAICQALLGAFGAKKGEGTSATRGRHRQNRHAVLGIQRCLRTPPFRPACTDCVRIGARALRMYVRPARAVQSLVHSSARTRAARCSWPVARSTPSRTQRAAQRGCGSAERTAVRAGGRPARVSAPADRAFIFTILA